MQGDQAAAIGSSGVLEPTGICNKQSVWGSQGSRDMENTLRALFFPSLCLKSLLQRNQGLKYDEAPGQQRKPNSITVKSNSGSRMDAREEQARAGGSFQSQMWGSGG